METFITTNDLLKQTALPEIFHKGETQQKTNTFLEMMQTKYGEDPQFKHVLATELPTDISPAIRNQYKSTWVAGWASRMLNWIRDHELRQLQEDFDNARQLVVKQA